MATYDIQTFSRRPHSPPTASRPAPQGRSRIPYINHPIALANILANEGGITDATVIVAALLHDTVEDTETTPADCKTSLARTWRGSSWKSRPTKSLPKAQRKRLQIEHAGKHQRACPNWSRWLTRISNLRDSRRFLHPKTGPGAAARVLRTASITDRD